MFDSGSGFLARLFGDTESNDAIARENQPGKKEYEGNIQTDRPTAGYTPETSSPDIEPDGSIASDGETATTSGTSITDRLRPLVLGVVGVVLLLVTTPFHAVLNLPSYIHAFNRWLAQLLGSLYGLVRTLTPLAAVLIGTVFVAGLIGTGVPTIDDTAEDGSDIVTGILDTDRSDHEHPIEQAVHEEVNDARAERGFSTLTFDHSVATVARNHSEDMATQNYFDHKNPDGQTAQDRLAEAGIGCHSVGENLYSEEGYGTSPKTVAERVVESWLDSPGHRENLLQRGWALEGIGVEIKGDGLWVTQVFCS